MNNPAIQKQQDYYTQTAQSYDSGCCFDPDDEHYIALASLVGQLSHFEVSTLLDVGCGTGRAIQYLADHCPDLNVIGLEPVQALREEGIKKGIPAAALIDGDATKLAFPDGAFDAVTMLGVLHHIPNPELAIQEALRVARKLVFISDHNIYGMGSWQTKLFKQSFRNLGLRRLLAYVMTSGKGYHDTTWDGIFYPFSIVDHIPLIQRQVSKLYLASTKTPAINLYRDASHISVLGVKNR
jgi:ubiquinone/menaquinone biosynthesis C-methylase UbiE